MEKNKKINKKEKYISNQKVKDKEFIKYMEVCKLHLCICKLYSTLATVGQSLWTTSEPVQMRDVRHLLTENANPGTSNNQKETK